MDLVGDLERIRACRDELTGQIEEMFLVHPLGRVLVTLCGFGPKDRSRTLAEISDPYRFANGGRLAAYAGLAPTNRRSGRSLNTAHQNRSGSHRLKDSMFLAAFVATQHDPDTPSLLPQTSRRQKAQRGGHLRRSPPLRPHLGHAQDQHPY